MKLRYKLLLLLILISLPAMALVRALDVIEMQDLSRKVNQKVSNILKDKAAEKLLNAVKDQVAILKRTMQVAESAVYTQKLSTERQLIRNQNSRRPFTGLRLSRDFKDSNEELELKPHPREYGIKDGEILVSYKFGSINLDQGLNQRDTKVTAQVARLRNTIPAFRYLHGLDKETLLWQRTVLEPGVTLTYPGHGAYPENYVSQISAWYQLATLEDREQVIWTPPYRDLLSNQMIFTCAVRIEDEEEQTIGATAVDIAMSDMFASFNLPTEWREEVTVMLVSLSPDQLGGEEHQVDENQIAVFAEWEIVQNRGQWTSHWPMITLQNMEEDIHRDLYKRMSITPNGYTPIRLDGRSALLAYHRIMDPDLYLVYIIPREIVIQDAQEAEAEVNAITLSHIQSAIPIMVSITIAVILMALMASKRMTRDVAKLTEAAERIQQGDLSQGTGLKRSDELGKLATAFDNMLPALRERLNMREALNLAGTVQSQLLPSSGLHIPGYEIYGTSWYCDETGGDFYDYFTLAKDGKQQLYLAIGDVTGHGVASALTMSSARALLKSQADVHADLPTIVTEINNQLTEDSIEGRFMTFMLMRMDMVTGSASFVGAGHDPIYVVDPDSLDVMECASEDIPLGIDLEWEFHNTDVMGLFRPKRILILGTDGIWEQRNQAGEMFGKERLIRVIRMHARDDAKTIAEEIYKAVTLFRGQREQSDDVTMVVVKMIDVPDAIMDSAASGTLNQL